MNCLELFSGTESFSKIARERGHNTFTVEMNPKFNPDLCADIFKLDFDDIIREAFFKKGIDHFDIIWASPPCTHFSVASLFHYWDHGRPATIKTVLSIQLVKKTLELIKDLQPSYWFVENPRGMLRSLDFMRRYNKKTVTYCKYGDFRQKPTDIWTNLTAWIPRPACSAGDTCHEPAPRGTTGGTQLLPDAEARAEIPPELFNEIFDVLEGKVKLRQKRLI